MNKEKNEQLIKEVLVRQLGHISSFEKVKSNFFNVFYCFYERVTSFKKMSIATQYQIIEAKLLIDLGSTKLDFSPKEVDDIKRALIIAMQSSDHWSMKSIFDRVEKIVEKIDEQESSESEILKLISLKRTK